MTRMLRVSLITLGDPGKLTGGYLYHRRMAELAPRHAASLDFVSVPERPFPLGIAEGAGALREIRQRRPDALVLDSIAAAFVGPWLAANAPPAPLLAMLHQPPGGIDHGPVRRLLQSPLDRLAYRPARLLLVASESLADEMAAAGVPRARMRIVPPGRDVAESAVTRDRLDLRGGRRAALLCVANWIDRKGILELLTALGRLPEDDATLHLAGDDAADPRYASRVRRLLRHPRLAGRVVVHGRVAKEEVAGLYASSDVFVLPSTREPYGTVWGEAMAAGLPVVGWAAGNLPYLGDDGIEAVMLPVGDVEGLAEAMHRLIVDEDERRRIGAAAARRAARRPTWNDAAGMFFDAIRQAAARG
jgi:glycosyltransferase involved in cell wall biosynthesis